MKKSNIVCTIFLLSIFFTACQSNLAEDKILDLLNEFRHRLCYELKKFGLPPLDPFELKELDGLEISGLKIGIKDLSAKGLSDFTVKKIKVTTVTFKFLIDVVIPQFILKTKYSINGKAGILDLNGKGDLALEIFNPQVLFEGKLKWSTAANQSSFEVLQLKPSVEKIKFDITGLFPNVDTNKFISQMITDIGLEIAGDYYKQYEALIISILEGMVTDKIKHLQPKDLLALITSGKPIFGEDDPKPDCKNKTILYNYIPKVNLLK